VWASITGCLRPWIRIRAMEIDETTDRTIVSTFVEKSARERLLAFIGKPRARGKLRRELLDLRRMNQGVITTVPAALQSAHGIGGLLAKSRPPADCYLVSENERRRGCAPSCRPVPADGWASEEMAWFGASPPAAAGTRGGLTDAHIQAGSRTDEKHQGCGAEHSSVGLAHRVRGGGGMQVGRRRVGPDRRGLRGND